MVGDGACPAPSTPAHQGSGSTKDNSDQTQQIPEMGSRWCPDEIEIFFECKYPTPI